MMKYKVINAEYREGTYVCVDWAAVFFILYSQYRTTNVKRETLV